MGNWFTKDNFILNTYDINTYDDIPKDDYDEISNIKCQYVMLDNTSYGEKMSLDVYYKYTDSNPNPKKNSREYMIKAFMEEMKRAKRYCFCVDIKVQTLDESEIIPSDYTLRNDYVDIDVTIKAKYGIGDEKTVYDLYFQCLKESPEKGAYKTFRESIESNFRKMLRSIENKDD